MIEKSEVLEVLRGFNPWWEEPQPLGIEEFKRIAFRKVYDFSTKTSFKRAIMLSGPRRVGKTTLLKQLAVQFVRDGMDPAGVIFISFDHPILKLIRLHKILKIIHEELYPAGKKCILLVDEVQYAQDWELELKQLIDHKPFYKIIATGSASVIHHQKLAESGVGRWHTIHMPTLSFYEYLKIADNIPKGIDEALRPNDLFKKSIAALAELAHKMSSYRVDFRRYLLVGGFPENVHEKNTSECQRLLREDVVERVIKRDMAGLFGVRNVDHLERLFVYICLSKGGIFSANSCASELGIPASTLNKHLHILEQANLVYRLMPFQQGGKVVLKARPKIYLVDAALRNAITLKGETALDDPVETGRMIEMAVCRHVYSYYYQDTPRICYWRDSRTKKEVDIIVTSPAYTIPIEVKYRNDASIKDKDGMVIFSQENKVNKGYWITRNDEDFGIYKKDDLEILKIPAHIFCYLIGQAERENDITSTS